jgi:hypothetical protein
VFGRKRIVDQKSSLSRSFLISVLAGSCLMKSQRREAETPRALFSENKPSSY